MYLIYNISTSLHNLYLQNVMFLIMNVSYKLERENEDIQEAVRQNSKSAQVGCVWSSTLSHHQVC